MLIYIASDHGGLKLKSEIKKHLKLKSIDFEDLGPSDDNSVDYPDFASKVAKKIQENKDAKGILICGTGQGIGIAANKHKGIRCAILNDVFSAKMAVAHNNANVFSLGERVIGVSLALEIVDAFLESSFEAGRHLRRVEKITKIEN